MQKLKRLGNVEHSAVPRRKTTLRSQRARLVQYIRPLSPDSEDSRQPLKKDKESPATGPLFTGWIKDSTL
jgi:hypothetical protein